MNSYTILLSWNFHDGKQQNLHQTLSWGFPHSVQARLSKIDFSVARVYFEPQSMPEAKHPVFFASGSSSHRNFCKHPENTGLYLIRLILFTYLIF